LDKAARGNYIIRQIKWQSLKCIEAVMRKYGFMFYGFSTGVLCKNSGTQGAAASHTLTLKDPFGLSSLSTGPNYKAYLASMFVVGEGVALLSNSTTLRANAIGNVTALSATTPSIDVTWVPGNATPTDNDLVVYANGVTGQTISETDANKWNVGLLDANTSTSVHGVSSGTESTWASALNDSNGGSLDFVKGKKIRQALENKGDTTLKRIVYSNGVENDFQARERGALLWTNSGR
jgi:hypothetical protein